MFHFDQHFTEHIRAAGQPTLPLWIFLASHGMWGFAVIAIALVATARLPILMILIPIVLTHLLTLGLQQIVRRERPPIAVSKIVMWRRTPSFPSAHSAGSIAFALSLSGALLSVPTFGPTCVFILFTFAFLIGLSRIIVGVHYVTDVLGGFIFGIFVTSIFLSVL